MRMDNIAFREYIISHVYAQLSPFPHEIWTQIVLLLILKDSAKTSEVCKYFYKLVHTTTFPFLRIEDHQILLRAEHYFTCPCHISWITLDQAAHMKCLELHYSCKHKVTCAHRKIVPPSNMTFKLTSLKISLYWLDSFEKSLFHTVASFMSQLTTLENFELHSDNFGGADMYIPPKFWEATGNMIKSNPKLRMLNLKSSTQHLSCDSLQALVNHGNLKYLSWNANIRPEQAEILQGLNLDAMFVYEEGGYTANSTTWGRCKSLTLSFISLQRKPLLLETMKTILPPLPIERLELHFQTAHVLNLYQGHVFAFLKSLQKLRRVVMPFGGYVKIFWRDNREAFERMLLDDWYYLESMEFTFKEPVYTHLRTEQSMLELVIALEDRHKASGKKIVRDQESLTFLFKC